MAETAWFTPTVTSPDPRMQRAIDGWLGLYEACYVFGQLARDGAREVQAARHDAPTPADMRLAEGPGAYGPSAVRSPRPQDLLGALLAAAQCLNECQIPYVVAGGMALSFYGRERATKDVDFFLLTRKDHLDPLLAKFRERDIFPHPTEQPSELPPDSMFWYAPFEYGLPDAPPVQVDVLACESEFANWLLATGVESSLQGVRLRIVGPEGLILLKLRAGRGIDRTDVLHLPRANLRLDRAVLDAWAKRFKVSETLAELAQQALDYRRQG